MVLPEILVRTPVFNIPLTYAHYTAIALRRYWMALRYPPVDSRDQNVPEIIAKIKKDGWALLPDYIPLETCAQMRADIDKIIELQPDGLSSEYDGAEHRYYSFKFDSSDMQAFYDDPFLKEITETYLGTEAVNMATLASKSLAATKQENRIARWHRDSFGRQFKALAYLTDVTPQNGPFEYIQGTHRLAVIIKHLGMKLCKFLQWRYDDEEVLALIDATGQNSEIFLAPAGSVILVDTSCIHRAKPIVEGFRYALTNYYVERGRYREEIVKPLGVPYQSEY